jgi:hypothetical protein
MCGLMALVTGRSGHHRDSAANSSTARAHRVSFAYEVQSTSLLYSEERLLSRLSPVNRDYSLLIDFILSVAPAFCYSAV